MGYFFLGELLNGAQMRAMAVIMVSTTLVSFDFSRKGAVSFRRHTVFYMLIATTAWATEATLFKAVALDENVWRSVFWEHVALVVFGALLALLAPSLRRKFIAVWTANSKKVLALNGANEALFMVGNVTVSYAMLLAPIAIILLAESF
jgi:glycopeptide antibiotics resistance protein